MNKKQLIAQAGGVLLLVCCVALSAREVRTPLPLYKGYIHYPVDRNRVIENCLYLDINVWGAGYARSAINGYGPKQSDKHCGCPQPAESLDCRDSNKVDLATLLFGKTDFRLAEIFAGGVVGTAVNNPFLTISTISPRFDYREMGAFFGCDVTQRLGCEDRWRFGARGRLPYRDIEQELKADSDLVGETLEDVYVVRQETNTFSGAPVTNSQVYAARLDFLSSLKRIAFTANGGTEDLVIYRNSSKGNEMTIGNQKVSGGLSSAQSPLNTAPFVAAIQSNSGDVPASVRWAARPIDSGTVIQADGSGLSDLQRGRFVNNIDYTTLGNDTAAQSGLWIVPNVDPTTGMVLGDANTVGTEIANSVNALTESSVAGFLKEKKIDFGSGRTKALGDFDLELFVGFDPDWCLCHCEDFWGEFQFGIRAPTGKKVKDPLKLLMQPTGNNGHFELRPGIAGGCKHWGDIYLNFDLTYSWVLKAREKLPAAFVGATVKNIGPEVDGKVSWGYFWGHVNLTFLHPKSKCLGLTIGYEAYVKQKDKIHFDCPQALDFNGTLQTLDPKVLECHSNSVANKIRAELFFAGDCCNIFGGFSQVFSGKNVTRDTDLYLGLNVNF